MKRMKMILVLTTLAALLAMPAMAVQLGQESFETTLGWTMTPAEDLTQTDGDYFGRVDTTIADTLAGFTTGFGSIDGGWMIVGEDCNGSGGTLPSNAIFTVAVDAVPIAGYNNLTVTIAVNAKNALKYDIYDYMNIYANIDNTGDVLVGAMRDNGVSGGNYNSKLGPDFNLDGVADYEIADYANLEDYTFPISGTGDSIVIKIETKFSDGDEEIAYDNIRVDGELGGPTNESDAHVVASGVGAQATISSLVDTQGEKQIVHTCQIYDAGDGGLAQNTIIDAITFIQGNANNISWSNIAGAELFDGLTTYVGTVGGTSIGFSFVPALVLTDGGAAVDLELAVWLSTTLPYYADHSRFEFELGPSNFTVDPTGAFFALADVPVESGDLNNEIDIVATDIGVTTQPNAVQGVGVPIFFRAGFVDENGGIDEDWPDENITVSLNTGTGTLTSAGNGTTIMSSSGQSVFSDLLYDTAENGVILEVTSTSFAGPALTDPFDVEIAPTIEIDVHPLCWDGDITADALPFAVHINIEDWTDGASQDAYLKTYDGGSNPFHYTDANGWSSSTSWASKPVVTIDASGNYSGWLFLKSKAMTTFKPRVALVSNTSTRITGVNVAGTALDLGIEGGILMDSDGSTYTTGGNVVLAYNDVLDLIGTTIAEDNGYPTDTGIYAIAAHGFIMAVCEVCDEDVTFESWNPEFWPGNGVADATDTDFTCVEGGAAAEVGVDVILPVELSFFTAIAGDASVSIRWTTASESDMDRFEILRDGDIAHTVGASNSASTSDYIWVDNDVSNGTTYSYSLIGVGLDGSRAELAVSDATPALNDAVVTEYALHQNYPNPFNPETNITFDLVEGGFVSLTVYNLLGQEVASLVNGTMDAGRHVIGFSADNLTSGVYLYRIEAGDFSAMKKMILMK